jgi:predicted nucleic acid-binding Zn ribbon protein
MDDLNGYPEPARDTRSECRVCGIPIPPRQKKCRLCLTEHLEADSTETETTSTTWSLVGVLHMLVEARSFLGAIAKGGAAASLLSSKHAELIVDDCTLIYDLREDLPPQLTRRWPSLPPATPVSASAGKELLEMAKFRSRSFEQSETIDDPALETHLYDESGSAMRSLQSVVDLLRDVDDDVWLVPVLALERDREPTESTNSYIDIPTHEFLECRDCERTTEHRVDMNETSVATEWDGPPIWTCQVCRSVRYGPQA